MKSKARKSNTKTMKIVGISALILLLVACFLVITNLISNKNAQPSTEPTNNDTTSESINKDNPTQEQLQAGNEIKEESVTENNGGSEDSTTVRAVASLNSDTNTIRVQTTISKVTNEGNCTLTLTQGSISKVYTAVGIQALSSYSTCKGFSIDSSELSPGKWNINVKFVSGSITSSADTSVSI